MTTMLELADEELVIKLIAAASAHTNHNHSGNLWRLRDARRALAERLTALRQAAPGGGENATPQQVLVATIAQHFGLPKGKPAQFVRNGILETCQCFNCRHAQEAPAQPQAATWRVGHDGFEGVEIGSYTTLGGKQRVVLQQTATRVIHIYDRKWLTPILSSGTPGATP